MALGRLVNNSPIASISTDGTINCKTLNAVNINGENYSIGNIDEIRQLEMRVSCLENHIKAMEHFQDSKYKIVYGE